MSSIRFDRSPRLSGTNALFIRIMPPKPHRGMQIRWITWRPARVMCRCRVTDGTMSAGSSRLGLSPVILSLPHQIVHIQGSDPRNCDRMHSKYTGRELYASILSHPPATSRALESQAPRLDTKVAGPVGIPPYLWAPLVAANATFGFPKVLGYTEILWIEAHFARTTRSAAFPVPDRHDLLRLTTL